MALESPIWIEASGTDTPILLSARQYRTVIDAVYTAEGVCGLTDLVVSPRAAGANMSVDVSAGMVVITGDAVANQGKYLARSTAVDNVALAAAPVSGSRTDLIVAQLYDNQADSSGQYAWNPISVTGTTTAPASSVVLASVTVTSTTTSITSGAISVATRQYAQLRQAAYRPTKTTQVSEPSYATLGAFVDFTSGQWPPLTFTLPPSGTAWVTASGNVENVNTTISTAWINWRVSAGSISWTGDTGLSCAGGRVYGTRRTLVTGTPGTSVTLTPTWNISSYGGAGNTFVQQGVLAVEPVL